MPFLISENNHGEHIPRGRGMFQVIIDLTAHDRAIRLRFVDRWQRDWLRYLAVYRVKGDAIEVSRVLHGAQKWP